MSRFGYDLSITIGLALVAGGTWSKWGGDTACIVAGALVILLTFVAVAIGKR